MRRGSLSFAAVALTASLLAAGCSSDDDTNSSKATTTTAAAKATTTVAAADTTTTTSQPSGTIADVDFKNFTFDYPSLGEAEDGVEQVTVTNGEFTRGEQPDSFYFQVTDVDIADLDGDGVAEAAVSIYYNTGGSGQFTDVLIYRWKDSKPVYVTDDGIGDRGDGGLDNVDVAKATSGSGDVLVIRRNAEAQGACCPTALEERNVRLQGDALAQVGTTTKWAIIRVGINGDGETTSDPTVVKFLPGTARADLTGDATTPVTASFDAKAGQKLEFTLDADALKDNPLVVELSGPGGQGGRAGTDFDNTISVTLPDTGTYTLQFTAVGKVDDAAGRYFDGDLRIG